MRKENFCIAIDGPAGAGKSTVAQKVAARLGFVYIDTGAMYRALTWKCVQEGLQAKDVAAVEKLVKKIHIELIPTSTTQKVNVDGQDVTADIRSNAISRLVSGYAQIPAVRTMLVSMQKSMANSGGIVMDGRDIGTHVLPNAELKIFLTASVETRARRRLLEMEATDPTVTLEQLKRDMEERDRMDKERKQSPLTMAKDAILIDSSHRTIDEVTDYILRLCEDR